MSTFKQRIITTVAFTAIAAVCGILCGYVLISAITVKVTENRLYQYAFNIVADGETSSAELRTVLAAMGALERSACSGEEISYFRTLILESDFLKDAGRMRNGRVECSAVLGKPSHAVVQTVPDFRQQDGTTLYMNLPQYKSSKMKVLALQFRGFFVAFTPYTRMHLEPPPMHYTETVINAYGQKNGQLLGETPPVGESILTTDGLSRVGDNLYATQCSSRFSRCVTAYTSMPEVFAANRGNFSGCIALCGVSGAFFGLALSLLYRHNKSMEQQLRRAISRDKLRVVYQPIVDLASGRIAGAEALSRWTDEHGVAVSPDVFVRIAEDCGFVGEITRLVMRHALRDFGETLRQRDDFRLSVNVTASDLRDAAFLPMLDAAVNRAAVPARNLAIEITESSTARYTAAIEAIVQLRQRGHSVHIDDFGTGYSSLAYLHDLSVDAIKIDRAFTRAIGTEAVTVAILPQILAMAEALNLQVIAEGVETVQQAEYFAACPQRVLAQGGLFGRSSSASEILSLLAKEEKAEPIAVKAAPVAGERSTQAA